MLQWLAMRRQKPNRQPTNAIGRSSSSRRRRSQRSRYYWVINRKKIILELTAVWRKSTLHKATFTEIVAKSWLLKHCCWQKCLCGISSTSSSSSSSSSLLACNRNSAVEEWSTEVSDPDRLFIGIGETRGTKKKWKLKRNKVLDGGRYMDHQLKSLLGESARCY